MTIGSCSGGDYLGLPTPGEEAPQGQAEITTMTLYAVLLSFLDMQKHRLRIQYVQQGSSHTATTIAGSVSESDRAVETIEPL